MRRIGLILAGVFFVQLLSAQVVGGQHEKLFDLFLLEKYEDCYYKAFKMTEMDKYLRDAEPFLYVAMCNHKIAQDAELMEDYPDTFKDMIKYAQKAVKLIKKAEDKELETITIEDNQDFFDELKEYTLGEIFFLFVENKYAKSASYYRKLMKIYPQDENILFLAGIGEVMSNNRQGEMKLTDAKNLMKSKYSESGYKGDEISNVHFSKGMVAFTDWLVTQGRVEDAKDYISLARKYQPKDEAIEEQYNTLIE